MMNGMQHGRVHVALMVLVGLVFVGCTQESQSAPSTQTPSAPVTEPQGHAVDVTADGSFGVAAGLAYTARVISPLAKVATVAPALGPAQIAPPGFEFLTLDVELKNTSADRSEPVPVYPEGGYSTPFEVAIPASNSEQVQHVFHWDCAAVCIDRAGGLIETTPDYTGRDTMIAPGSTMTLRLYSSAVPSGLALSDVSVFWVEAITDTRTALPSS